MAQSSARDQLAKALTPAARVTHSVTQSIANVAVTALAFDTEIFDTEAIHDNVTNNSRLTCRTAGTYLICAGVLWGTVAGGLRMTRITLNGTVFIARDASEASGGGNVEQSVAAVYPLVVNDYVTVEVYQASGAALNAVLETNHSPIFSMVRVA